MTSITSIKTLFCDLPPSCIQFCPAAPQYFVVGTYLLHANDGGAGENENSTSVSTESQRRSGSLIIYRLDGDDILHTITVATPTCSILDLQWCPHPGMGNVLAVATSTGNLEIYRFVPPSAASTASLDILARHQVTNEDTLVLSLLWHPSRSNAIGATFSDGSVCLCTSSSSNGDPWSVNDHITTQPLAAHSLEAWCLSFLPAHETVLSGGDDAVLARTSLSDPLAPLPQWTDRKTHLAGVTAILPLEGRDDLVVTGSYDDHIRLLHVPASGRRRVLAEANLGGGVWRIKLLGSRGSVGVAGSGQSLTLLASCMHAGARILRLSQSPTTSSSAAAKTNPTDPAGPADEASWTFATLFRFEEHASMNYGSDVAPAVGSAEGDDGDGDDDDGGDVRERLTTVVSTSFYDRRVCLWRVRL